ncbi:ead/Ea22-like family protein [Salmonella sp. NW859]|uniref:ead/Ea22-like family protein n=1 Tax=unclassified Salmonella TaxID=2614656 RepID=UPI0034E386FA
MSNIDKQALRERYSPKPVPECHICGKEMTIQRMSASRITYGCTGATYDDKGCHYADGRSIADDHYEQSRVTVVDVSDPDVLALLDELEHYKSREERVTKLVLDNSTSWDALYKKLEAAEKRIAELTDQKATWVTWAENASGMVDMLRLRIAELERSETQLINERDSAEFALNDAYKAVMGQAPEWSNWFSFENAIDEIELVCELWRNQTDDVIQFRQRIQELEAKLETADRLQDGAFRDGLKAGFSYGQTDDQSGFTQCMSAYNTMPASLLPDGLIRAVHFYEQVKHENPPVETGAWKDAIDWVLKEACLAASTLESSREHEVISQQEKA